VTMMPDSAFSCDWHPNTGRRMNGAVASAADPYRRSTSRRE